MYIYRRELALDLDDHRSEIIFELNSTSSTMAGNIVITAFLDVTEGKMPRVCEPIHSSHNAFA